MNRISWINVALGLWMIAAGFVLPHAAGVGVVEDVITGSFLALAALWAARAYRPRVGLAASWCVLLMGLWIVAAPFAIGHERQDMAVVNDVIVGLVVLVLGIVNVARKGRLLTQQTQQT